MTVDEATPRARQAVVAEIESRARALEESPDFPRADVVRARAAARDLDALEIQPGDLGEAITLLEQRSAVQVVVPVGSRRSLRGLARRLVVRLGLWHARQLAQQLSFLGHATVRLGLAVRQRVDGLEGSVARQQAEMDEFRARLDRLDGPGTPPAIDPPASRA